MPKVVLTILESDCRCGYHKKGDTFVVEDLCPPVCHELWNSIYPGVYAILNGAVLDYGTGKEKKLEMKCPDNGRVTVRAEVMEE